MIDIQLVTFFGSRLKIPQLCGRIGSIPTLGTTSYIEASVVCTTEAFLLSDNFKLQDKTHVDHES